VCSEWELRRSSAEKLEGGRLNAKDRGLSSSFFTQDTPAINASFWVERNAPPLSQV
jgi:hypothetical protein